MLMKIDQPGLAFIEKWEAYVGYWYDDKVAPHKIGGKLVYPEYTGGPVRGTLTIGIGHTKAAKAHIDLVIGMRMNHVEARGVLDVDLDPCEAAVNRLVKVAITQGMFRALVSFVYNCGETAFAKSSILRKLNAGNYKGARASFALYNKSQGEEMLGLKRRRAAEQALWDQDAPAVEAADPTKSEEMMAEPVPKADDHVAETKPIVKSTEQIGSLTQTGIGTGGIAKEVAAGIDSATVTDHVDKAIAYKERAEAFGVEPIELFGKAGPVLEYLIHSPIFWFSTAVAVVGVFLFLRRRWRSRQEL